jgi:hypothetical protein
MLNKTTTKWAPPTHKWHPRVKKKKELCCHIRISSDLQPPLESDSTQSFGKSYGEIKPYELIIWPNKKGRASWEMHDPQLAVKHIQ